MAESTADFEAGVNGNTITTGAGEASATAWNQVNGTPAYDNAQKAHGGLAGKLFTSGDLLLWTVAGSPTEHYGRVYVRLSSYTTAGLGWTRLLTIRNSTATDSAKIGLFNDGRIIMLDFADTNFALTTETVPLNTWVRIEYHVIHSETVGQVEVKLFNPADSSSPVETKSSPASWNTKTELGDQYYSFQDYANPFWVDDIVANATSYPGPAASEPTPQVLSMQSHVFGHNMW